MKIDISRIILEHLRTLRDQGHSRIALKDIATFYIAPILFSIIGSVFICDIDDNVLIGSLTVFSIFAALLLNVQIAIFGIFQREWDIKTDKIKEEIVEEKLKLRRKLISEINTNVSYLILITCVALTCCLIFLAFSVPQFLMTGLLAFIYTHFLLTLLMVIKRSHNVFEQEYLR